MFETTRGSQRQRVVELACLAATLVMCAVGIPAVEASQILAPGVGGPDGAMNGATVATPRSPSAAAYSNPGAMTVFPHRSFGGSIGIGFASLEVHTADPPGYRDDYSATAIIPEAGIALKGPNGWTYGFATYGAVGSVFEFEEAPELGVPGVKTEFSALTAALVVAYQLTPELSVGAALEPMFGKLHVRFASPGDDGPVPVHYTVRGLGVQGSVGARWAPRDDLAFGLGVRVPGRIWMDGSALPPTGERIGVDLELQMPAQVFVGVNGDFGERLSWGVYGRWTDTSRFGRSLIQFDRRPEGTGAAFADTPFVSHANDEWRGAVGLEYHALSWLSLLAGTGYGDAIVGEQGVSPLLFDSAEWKASLGATLHGEVWNIDVVYGHSFHGARTIDENEALLLPGDYEFEADVVFFGLRRII